MGSITKNQHYVPQSYLRCFSADNSSIGTFCIEDGRYFEKATIKGQAKKEWFYDKNNELENSFSEIEGRFLQNRQSIAKDPKAKLSRDQWEILYQDMIVQLMRTPNMANKVDSIINAESHRIWEHDSNPIVRELADSFTAKMPNAIINAMHVMCKHPYILLDLKWRLVINNTDLPFITSDNPVCLYNQFAEKRHNNLCGLALSGLQVFYPLTPQLGVFYFDGDIYKCGPAKRHFIEISPEDVFHLNILIALNATVNIFYNTQITDLKFIQNIIKIARNYRKNSYKDTEIPITPNSSYVVMQHIMPLCKLNLSFTKELDKARIASIIGYRKNVIFGDNDISSTNI